MIGSMHWLAKYAALFCTSLVHEDVAIVAAGFLVIEHGVSFVSASLTLFLGLTTGDFLLYGLGAAARYLPLARRLLITRPVERMRAWLARHLVLSVATCRLLPGVLFPTFVACGWFKLSFRKFAITSVLSAACYVPVAIALAIVFRTTVFSGMGRAGWAVMLGVVLAVTLLGAAQPKWGLLGKIMEGAKHLKAGPAVRAAPAHLRVTHAGMPPLGRLRRWVAISERIPPMLFYVPSGLHWIGLGLRYRSFTLPALANPMIKTGGLWGESKSECLLQVGPEHGGLIAPFVTAVKNNNEVSADEAGQIAARMRAAGFDFPVVLKPDIGWQGFGVRLLASAEELRQHMSRFPNGATLLLQQYVPYDGEAGVLYCRFPGEQAGRIYSMAFRYFPHVVGDGQSTLHELILKDPRAGWKAHTHLGGNRLHNGHGTQDLERIPADGEVVRLCLIGSIRTGGLYRDACAYITPALTAKFDAVAHSMPEFHFGRFDIRFESVENLQAGEGFRIIEVNGAGSEAIHAWDHEKSVGEVYRTLLDVQRILFRIGDRNRARGFKPMRLSELVTFSRMQHRLMMQYPPSG